MIDPMYVMASGGPGGGIIGGGTMGGGGGGKRGKYQKLGDEEEGMAGGVWSVEMDERRGGEGRAERYEMGGGARGDGDKDTYR